MGIDLSKYQDFESKADPSTLAPLADEVINFLKSSNVTAMRLPGLEKRVAFVGVHRKNGDKLFSFHATKGELWVGLRPKGEYDIFSENPNDCFVVIVNTDKFNTKNEYHAYFVVPFKKISNKINHSTAWDSFTIKHDQDFYSYDNKSEFLKGILEYANE